MQEFSPVRGRKKEVAKFSRTQGFWVLGIGLGMSILIVLLYLLGFLRFDMD